MAVACSRCGMQNPDGNAFCTTCGAPLPVAAATPPASPSVAPAPAPPATPSPPTRATAPAPLTPPVYTPGQSPYLPPPPPGGASAHRLSRNAIIALVAVAVLIIGGAGIAFAALHHGGATPVPPSPTNLPTPRPTAQPTLSPTPTPTASGAPANLSTVDTPFATIVVPNAFTVTDQKADFVQMTDAAKTGLLIVSSDPLAAGTTNSQLDASLLQTDQSQLDPNAGYCSGSSTQSLALAGSGGQIPADETRICANVTPQNGAAFQAEDVYIAGVARASDGSLKSVVVDVYAPADRIQAFAGEIPDAFFSDTAFKDATAP